MSWKKHKTVLSKIWKSWIVEFVLQYQVCEIRLWQFYMEKIGAIGLFTKDMKSMVEFYRDVIGMKTGWKEGEPYVEFEGNGGSRLIMFSREDFEKMAFTQFTYPKDLNGSMEIAFDMPNYSAVDVEYSRLVSLGVRSVMPPTTQPWGQRACFIADPEGNLIEIGSFIELKSWNILFWWSLPFLRISFHFFQDFFWDNNWRIVSREIISVKNLIHN